MSRADLIGFGDIEFGVEGEGLLPVPAGLAVVPGGGFGEHHAVG